MKRTFTVKITGSGTAGQIASSLYEVAAEIHNVVNFGSDEIEMKREDGTLIVEIQEE